MHKAQLTSRNFILLYILCAFTVLFIVLLVFDRQALQEIPVVGEIFGPLKSSSTTTSGNASQSANPLVVGSITSNGDIQPVGGSKLTPVGGYKDGDYEGYGSTAGGVLIMDVTIAKGAITNITFQQIPSGAPEGVLHELAAEAIQKQVVAVSSVNGYDSVSNAFRNALGVAIKSAFAH